MASIICNEFRQPGPVPLRPRSAWRAIPEGSLETADVLDCTPLSAISSSLGLFTRISRAVRAVIKQSGASSTIRRNPLRWQEHRRRAVGIRSADIPVRDDPPEDELADKNVRAPIHASLRPGQAGDEPSPLRVWCVAPKLRVLRGIGGPSVLCSSRCQCDAIESRRLGVWSTPRQRSVVRPAGRV